MVDGASDPANRKMSTYGRKNVICGRKIGPICLKMSAEYVIRNNGGTQEKMTAVS